MLVPVSDSLEPAPESLAQKGTASEDDKGREQGPQGRRVLLLNTDSSPASRRDFRLPPPQHCRPPIAGSQAASFTTFVAPDPAALEGINRG